METPGEIASLVSFLLRASSRGNLHYCKEVWVIPGSRLSMRCVSPAALVTFCAGLWISNHVLAQGLEAGVRPRADCEGEQCVTCLHGGYTAISLAITTAVSPGPACKYHFTQEMQLSQ